MTTLPHIGCDHRWILTHDWSLELSLEFLKVTDVPLNQSLLTGRGEVVPQCVWSGRSAIAEGIGVDASRGIVPPDLVGDGIDDLKVFRKGAGGDLVIISWVAPSTKSALRGIVEDGCFIKVRAGVYGA